MQKAFSNASIKGIWLSLVTSRLQGHIKLSGKQIRVSSLLCVTGLCHHSGGGGCWQRTEGLNKSSGGDERASTITCLVSNGPWLNAGKRLRERWRRRVAPNWCCWFTPGFWPAGGVNGSRRKRRRGQVPTCGTYHDTKTRTSFQLWDYGPLWLVGTRDKGRLNGRT